MCRPGAFSPERLGEVTAWLGREGADRGPCPLCCAGEESAPSLSEDDRANGLQLSSAQALARHILQIMRAVERSPKNPNFRVLAIYTTSFLDSGGGDGVGPFRKYIAEQQKYEGFAMKQERLYREETTHDTEESGKVGRRQPKRGKKGDKEEE